MVLPPVVSSVSWVIKKRCLPLRGRSEQGRAWRLQRNNLLREWKRKRFVEGELGGTESPGEARGPDCMGPQSPWYLTPWESRGKTGGWSYLSRMRFVRQVRWKDKQARQWKTRQKRDLRVASPDLGYLVLEAKLARNQNKQILQEIREQV